MQLSHKCVAVVGAGTIGASWASLFLAHGLGVRVHDTGPQTEGRVRAFVIAAWSSMRRLVPNAPEAPPLHALSFHETASGAVEGCKFVQESTPERLEIKHETLAAFEHALEDDAIVASSASGLKLTDMQKGMRAPGRLILGHPFNPPHLIPLVELFGNEKTENDVLDKAEDFYRTCGKVTIRLNREVPGHVANRLQAALWREAIHLAVSGVASVKDVDLAVSAGPGLRWAIAGPTTIFSLGAGTKGLGAFCEHFAPSFHEWWDDLGDPRLDAATIASLTEDLELSRNGSPLTEMERERDERLASLIMMFQKKQSLGG
jgi:3-hydroxybutyryl-CoA dehydrogenase